MNYIKANEFYGQSGKQLGDKLIYITSNGIDEQFHGYKITSFNGFDPENIEYVSSINDDGDNGTAWNRVYDKLFGHALSLR